MDRIEEYMVYLKPLCIQYGVPVEMVRDLIKIELEKSGMRRRHNIFVQLREVVEKYIDAEVIGNDY